MAEWWPDVDYEAPEEFIEEEGGDVEQPEAMYTFHTALDERVCGQCAPLEGVMFSESEISEWFPSADQLADDFIEANVHDRCRCQLTKVPVEQGTEDGGGEEGMEGRGEPLSMAFRAMRSPQGLVRYAARRGLRGALGAMGATALAPFLVPMIFSLVLPLVMTAVQQWIRQQALAEIRRQARELEKKQAQQDKENFKGVTSE